MSASVRAALSALALCAAAAHPAATQQPDFRWSGAVAAGDRVEVKGVNGDVRAEAASGGEVEVIATRRGGRRSGPESVRIETVRHDGGVTVCAVYPTPAGSRSRNRCAAGDEWQVNNEGNDVVVDFVVRVPRGVHFVGRTVNGDVEARRLPADAVVATVNGEVEVSAAGVVEASTVNGSIQASTGRADPGRDLAFSTVNGNIALEVPAGFRARVEASLLNGSISSDFPLTIRRGRFVGQNAHGAIGSGGRELRLDSVNGNIRIRLAGS